MIRVADLNFMCLRKIERNMEELDAKIQGWVDAIIDKTFEEWEQNENGPVGVEFDIDEFKREIVTTVVSANNVELPEDEMSEFECECEFAVDVHLGKLMAKRLCCHVEGAVWMVFLG